MKKFYFGLLFVLTAVSLSAMDIFIQDYNLKASISFEKERYRIGEDMYLNIEISNNQDDAVYFFTSPYKLNNIRVTILQLKTGEVLEEKYSRIMEVNNLKQDKPEYFSFSQRILYPDEVLKYRINLPDYFEFVDDGRYKIQIEFDPFPNTSDPHKLFLSNAVYLLLDKSIEDQVFENTIMELKKKEEERLYTPEGTVQFLLEEYIKKDWENYFLYQDLNKIILKYDEYGKPYLKASQAMKKQLIEDFKNWYISQVARDIEEFQILNVFYSYEDNSSHVNCRIKYKEPAVNKTFFYEYTLYKKGIKWIVSDYDVVSYSKKK